MKELKEVGKDDKTSGVKAVPKNEGDLRSLHGTIQGPVGTCYEVSRLRCVALRHDPFKCSLVRSLFRSWAPVFVALIVSSVSSLPTNLVLFFQERHKIITSSNTID
jgi:hypothetical protein